MEDGNFRKVIDARDFTQGSRELAATIEKGIEQSQVRVKNHLPTLPNYIILTSKQFKELRKARKVKRIGQGAYLYITRLNVMEVSIQECDEL